MNHQINRAPPRPGPGAQRARMREADKHILNQDFYRGTPILEVMTRQLARANMRKRAKALARKLSRDAAAELVKLRAAKRAEAEKLFGRVPGPRPIKSDGTFSLRPDHLYANKARRGRHLRAIP